MTLHRIPLATIAAACAIGITSLAQATPTRAQSGSFGGVDWQAQSTIVGVGSTATLAGGGNPAYFASMPKYSGAVALIMDYGSAGAYICSGTLLPNRYSILTAAHCVSDGTSARPLSTTAWFYGGPNPDTVVYFNPVSTAVAVAGIAVNSAYTGEVIDHNDIAVLNLAALAPDWAASYGLYGGNDLTGQDFNVAGYGGRSTLGGAGGVNLGVGRLRQGDNRYDFRLGDADFGPGWGVLLDEPMSQIEYSYLSDFDNGSAANDTSCLVADAFFGLGGPKYCNNGRGFMEVGVAGGDSGGPQFIDGEIASVTSYGMSFGSGYGDVDNRLNSTFGEFSGFVPVHIHRDFIAAAMVPEPGTYGLALLGLLAAGRMRRRSA